MDTDTDTEAGPSLPPGPQKGKNGPGTLKHTCYRCGIKKWVIDFKEGKSADLLRTSVCLFCELQLTIEKQATQLRNYEKSLQEVRKQLEQQAKQHEEQLQALRERLEEEPAAAAPSTQSPSSSPARLVSRLETQESRTELISRRVSFLEKARTNGDREKDGGRRVRLDASVIPPSTPASHTTYAAAAATPIAARVPQPNQEKEKKKKKTRSERRKSRKMKETKKLPNDRAVVSTRRVPVNLLIGDSLTGRHTQHRFEQLRQENQVKSFPGAKIRRLTREITLLDIDRESTLIVSVGGNDLFLNGKRSGSTEGIVQDFERLLHTIKTRVNRAVVVGLIPRKYATREHYSKACWLNRRLGNLCRTYSLRYVDL